MVPRYTVFIDTWFFLATTREIVLDKRFSSIYGLKTLVPNNQNKVSLVYGWEQPFKEGFTENSIIR